MAARWFLGIGCLAAILLTLAVASRTEAQVYPVVPVRPYFAPVYAPYPYAVYNPRRAYRQAVRYGVAPLYQPWPVPVVMVDRFGAPMYGPVAPSAYGTAHPPAASAPQPAESAPSSSGNAPSAYPELVPTPAGESGVQ